MDLEHLRRIGLNVPQGPPSMVLRRRGSSSSAAVAVENGHPPPPPDAAVVHRRGGACCIPTFKVEGLAQDPLKREGHPEWYRPTRGVDLGLRTMNSLTGEKEAFLPLEGKKVRWYTCGPTVYDVAHMGHARAYLTFDILRRIMVNHFKYEVLYQINITDIDDKIILRSRQNRLYSDFEAEAAKMDLAELHRIVDAAIATIEKKLQDKKPADLPKGAPEKDKKEFEKLQMEYELKAGQHDELLKRLAAARGSKEALIAAAREPLMAKLDKERGHLVTDHAIFDAHSRHFEREYFDDMKALGIQMPDVVTRISDYMDGRVQRFVEKLVQDGMAYESAGSVYFDINAFEAAGFTYRKLVPAAETSAAEMEEGEGALASNEGEKRNPNDFALWKKSKPGEPAWDSAWGKGRPGWHIECSVMATDKNGEFLDVHAGGEDLKFPHHDNEMAQTEAYLCRHQWVNYFWHAGHLHIEGLKMSKSLKNFITIRQALEEHSARQLRIMFLMQQWDKGMNYSDQAIEMARAEERKVKHFLGCLQFFKRCGTAKGADGAKDKELRSSIATSREKVDEALKDNFNTARVIDLVSRLITECYQVYEALPEASLAAVEEAARFVEETLAIFGVENFRISRPKQDEWAQALDAFAECRDQVRCLAKEKADLERVAEVVEKFRPAAKAAKAASSECAQAFTSFLDDLAGAKAWNEAFKRCDAARDQDFVNLGVRLEDRGVAGTGFVWMFEDADVMRREQRDQAAKALAAMKDKLRKKLELKRGELEAAEKSAISPEQLFQVGANKGLYAAFDDNGVPTKLAGGEEVSNSKKKDFAKKLAKQLESHTKLQKQAGDMGVEAYLEKLRGEVADLEQQYN